MDGKAENRKEKANCFAFLGSEPKAICFSIAVGKATDNICIERFWRSIKYEEIYLNEYKNMKVLKKSIGKYMDNYNQTRLHSAINYQTPNEVYFQAINNPNSKGDQKLPKVS